MNSDGEWQLRIDPDWSAMTWLRPFVQVLLDVTLADAEKHYRGELSNVHGRLKSKCPLSRTSLFASVS